MFQSHLNHIRQLSLTTLFHFSQGILTFNAYLQYLPSILTFNTYPLCLPSMLTLYSHLQCLLSLLAFTTYLQHMLSILTFNVKAKFRSNRQLIKINYLKNKKKSFLLEQLALDGDTEQNSGFETKVKLKSNGTRSRLLGRSPQHRPNPTI